MNNPLISIIVPIYKAEQELKRCINSILDQTYTDFELILVDDGSPDNCPAICDDFAKKDSRVKVIHKDNKGVSSARNSGIQIASSDYITFIDSDDYVENVYLSHLMELENFDYIVGGYWLNERDSICKKIENMPLILTMDQIIEEPIKINAVPMGMVWARRYKKAIIDKHSLNFDETISRGEDVLFNAIYLTHCKSIQVLPVTDYYYCLNFSETATNRFYSQLFAWSMKGVEAIGEIIGTENEVFYQRVWRNAEYVYNEYLKTVKGKKLKTQLQLIVSVFAMCKNPYLRKSINYAPNKKMSRMLKYYLLPFWPYLYIIRNQFRQKVKFKDEKIKK